MVPARDRSASSATLQLGRRIVYARDGPWSCLLYRRIIARSSGLVSEHWVWHSVFYVGEDSVKYNIGYLANRSTPCTHNGYARFIMAPDQRRYIAARVLLAISTRVFMIVKPSS